MDRSFIVSEPPARISGSGVLLEECEEIIVRYQQYFWMASRIIR